MRESAPSVAFALTVSACSRTTAASAGGRSRRRRRCPQRWKAGWQRLASRVSAPVYCPSWMPSPLDGEIGGQWDNGVSVEKDQSYLVSFLWHEPPGQDVHVNFRGLPGPDEDPALRGRGGRRRQGRKTYSPCFSDPHGKRRLRPDRGHAVHGEPGVDQWHVLYAWNDHGTLYAVSEHVASRSPSSRSPQPRPRDARPRSRLAEGHMKLTRKELLAGGAAGAALGAAGIYELVDQLADCADATSGEGREPEQHLLDGCGSSENEASRSLSRRCTTRWSPRRSPTRHGSLAERTGRARAELLRSSTAIPPTPAGLGVTVAWGLPYFHALRARRGGAPSAGRPARAASAVRLLDAGRFPSDPPDDVLEENDVAVLLPQRPRGAHRRRARDALFDELDGMLRDDEHPQGLRGRRLRRRRRACRSGWRWPPACPGADLIPDTPELFLGFTSTQKARPRPAADRELRDARLRRPRRRRLLPQRHAHAPLAPVRGPRGLVPQLRLPRARRHDVPPGPRRAARTRRPSRRGRTTCRRRPRSQRDYGSARRIGHSASIQTPRGSQRDVRGPDGTRLREGHGDPAARRLQHARQPVLLERDARARPA